MNEKGFTRYNIGKGEGDVSAARGAFADQRGFSLIELLIALFILTIGLLGTATMLSTNIGSNRAAQGMTVEAALASSVMEEFLSLRNTDPLFTATVAGAVYDLDPDTAATTRTIQGRVYSATYSITTNTPVLGSVSVAVTVTSPGRSLTMTTFKSAI